MFRWAALAERLKVTQEKINNIQSGKIKIETLLAKETVYKGEPRMQQDHSPHLVGPRVRASSLPILKSFTGEVKTRRREEEKQERALRRASERARKRLEREADNVPGGFKPAVFRPKPLPKHPETGLNIRQLRQLLMDEAKARGDIAEAGIIAQESEQQLLERFQILQRSAPGNADPPRRDVRSGPSNETRKKLREKRKKAKR